jgi:hypothetical protein
MNIVDSVYWWVGAIVVNLVWIIPSIVVVIALINGLLVSISLTTWEVKICRTNDIKYSKWKLIKLFIGRIFTECLTDSNTTVRGPYGTWNYLFKHTVWKVAKEDLPS